MGGLEGLGEAEAQPEALVRAEVVKVSVASATLKRRARQWALAAWR